MDEMGGLQVERAPQAERPLLVMGFREWSNAADAAATAVEWLMEAFGGERFAWFPPERFFQYTCGRPFVEYKAYALQELRMPRFEFFDCPGARPHGGLVLGLGSEPNVGWEAFCGGVAALARHCRVSRAVMLGTQTVHMLHTAPVRVEAAGTEPGELAALAPPREYRGPGGAVDALLHRFGAEGLRAAGLWANVPCYVAHLRSPRAVHALLAGVARLARMPIDLSPLEEAFEEYDRQVEELIANDRRAAAHVQRIRAQEEGKERQEEKGDRGAETPEGSAEDLADEVQRFLRKKRDEERDG